MRGSKDRVSRTIAVYNRDADTYLRQWGKRTIRLPSLLLEWEGHLRRRGMVLDLGCGAGQDGRYLRRAGFHVVGLDLSWCLLAYARRRSRRLPLVYADLRRPPFKSQRFHGIWAAASLIHVTKADARRALRHLGAQVMPGGVLAATFIHGRDSGYLERGWIPGRYVSRWLKGDLQAVVEQTGWKVLSLRTVTNRERKGRWLNLLARRPAR